MTSFLSFGNIKKLLSVNYGYFYDVWDAKFYAGTGEFTLCATGELTVQAVQQTNFMLFPHRLHVQMEQKIRDNRAVDRLVKYFQGFTEDK